MFHILQLDLASKYTPLLTNAPRSIEIAQIYTSLGLAARPAPCYFRLKSSVVSGAIAKLHDAAQHRGPNMSRNSTH
jgi:hypothetical protein